MRKSNNVKTLLITGASIMAASPMFASGGPIDLAATGTQVAGYIGAAAGAGIAVFAAIVGIKVIKKAFTKVAG